MTSLLVGAHIQVLHIVMPLLVNYSVVIHVYSVIHGAIGTSYNYWEFHGNAMNTITHCHLRIVLKTIVMANSYQQTTIRVTIKYTGLKK